MESCPRADLLCTWTGPRGQVSRHFEEWEKKPLEPVVRHLMKAVGELSEALAYTNKLLVATRLQLGGDFAASLTIPALDLSKTSLERRVLKDHIVACPTHEQVTQRRTTQRAISQQQLYDILRHHLEEGCTGHYKKLTLNSCTLSGLYFPSGNYSNSQFRNSDLSNSMFTGASNFSKADLSGSNLSDIDLSQVDLTGANLSGQQPHWSQFAEGSVKR